LVAVSAVSGGSITAAVLADRWPELQHDGFTADSFDEHVAAPFVAAVSEHNMRNRGLARWALTRVTPRRRGLGATIGVSIASRLLRARKVVELPSGLQVILTSTDLVSGRAFRVSQEFIGGWQFGYAPTPTSLSTATALAASTAVPFLFPPVALRTDALGLRDGTPPELALVDGGVYDNLGLEWFQGWDRGRPRTAREADFILVVDASGPLRLRERRYGWLRALRRSQEAQYAQTRASRVRWFIEQLIDEKMRGLYVPIDRDPRAFQPPGEVGALSDAADGSLPPGFASALSALRTDLDRFLPEEAALLMYHGYWATHVRLLHLRPDLATASPRWRDYANLPAGQQTELLSMLAGGARRSLRRSSLS
jgi:NTE family protein